MRRAEDALHGPQRQRRRRAVLGDAIDTDAIYRIINKAIENAGRRHAWREPLQRRKNFFDYIGVEILEPEPRGRGRRNFGEKL